MTKRIMALLLALLLALSLAACGDNPDPTDPPTAPPTNPPTDPTDPPTDPTDPPTDPVTVDAQTVYDSCIALMGEMVPLDPDMMLDFCGIKAEDCAQAYVAISADGLLTDEIWVIEAVDEEAAQRLLDKVSKRLKAKAEESETYSPEQYAVVQKAQTIHQGNFVILLVAPNVDELKNVVDAAFGNE